MKKLTLKIDNNEFLFVNESEDTRHGFRHVCNLFINDYNRATISRSYYNRTWERYTYQTVMMEAIQAVMDEIYESELRYYKEHNDIKRLTAAKRQAFEDGFNNQTYKSLQEAYAEIKNEIPKGFEW